MKSIAIALMISAGLAACGGKSNKPTTPSNTSGASDPSGSGSGSAAGSAAGSGSAAAPAGGPAMGGGADPCGG